MHAISLFDTFFLSSIHSISCTQHLRAPHLRCGPKRLLSVPFKPLKLRRIQKAQISKLLYVVNYMIWQVKLQ